MAKNNKKSKKKIIVLLIIIFVIAAIGAAAYYVYQDYIHRMNVSCIIECGEEVSADMLLRDTSKTATFINTGNLDTNVAGTYDVQIKSDFFTYDCQIIVADTTPPTGTVEDKDILIGETLSASDFFTYTYDVSPVTISYEVEPDFSAIGKSPVSLLLTDSSDNITTYEATLTIHEIDTEPPVLHGVSDFTIYIGDTISYKNRFTVTDNCDEDISFEIEGAVDTHKEGIYPLTVSATDWCQNTVSQDFQVTVIQCEYTQEQLDEVADKILASIIKDDMADLDKLNAIYDWIKSHTGFIDHSDKGDWIKSAYIGLTMHQGDCYVYASMAKELLTRAGIKNEDIHKIPTPRSSHYWNLVDIGEGWRHFDTTPRTDHPRLCYLTDEQMWEYSNSHWNSHRYDKDVYNFIE